jgi:hypothetical protein
VQRKHHSKRRPNPQKIIKDFADYQQQWAPLIPELRRCTIQSVDFLSIAGMAPKDFITDREYRPGHRLKQERSQGYIAKVGSKFYPNESITEQLVTRLGQTYGLNIADSKLRIVNGQVRFMSKYFLNGRTQQLTHGAEIFALALGKEKYEELAKSRKESEHFTFQTARAHILAAFPEAGNRIVSGFVEMLAFDALIGHNDRHPYNWGVIVPLKKRGTPRFSPIFDTARALFWNVPEHRIKQMLKDRNQFETYVNKCAPPVGWDGEDGIDFFRLLALIWGGYSQYRVNVSKLLDDEPLKRCLSMIDKEFDRTVSPERSELIKRCLSLRHQLLRQAVTQFGSVGE